METCLFKSIIRKSNIIIIGRIPETTGIIRVREWVRIISDWPMVCLSMGLVQDGPTNKDLGKQNRKKDLALSHLQQRGPEESWRALRASSFEALLNLCKFLAKFVIAFPQLAWMGGVKSPTNSMTLWGLYTITKEKIVIEGVCVMLNFQHLTSKSGLSRIRLSLS